MRIFCFGESHVIYNYPTWADIILQDYDGYNCAEIGCSNQLIAHRIVEAHKKFVFNENDYLVINWAQFFREDRYHTNKGWHCAGSIFHNLHNKPFMLNNYMYRSDAEWADLFHYIYRDMNTISAIQGFLKSTRITNVIQMHSNDFTKDEKFLEIEGVRDLITQYKDDLHFDVDSVMDFTYTTYNEKTRPKFTFDGKTYITEDHPLPNEHLIWLENVLGPKMNISVSAKTRQWCQEWNDRIFESKIIRYPTTWQAKTPDWII